MQRIEAVLQHIIPIEAYVNVIHEIPYTYQLSAGVGAVTVVGVNHVHERAHPSFALLDSIFTHVPLDLVLVEGMDTDFNEPLARKLLAQLTPKEAALRGGEAVYAVVKAIEERIAWQPAEPEDDMLFSYLESLGFKRPDMLSWYALRLLPQYIASGEMIAFSDYLEPFIAEIERATKWGDVSYDATVLLEHGTAVLGHHISLHNFAQAFSYTDPRAVIQHDNDFSVFNTLSATADVLRDRTMVTRVLKEVAAGKQVLLVCGVAHAVMQEPAYRAFVA